MPTTTNKERVNIAELIRLEAERLRILDLKALNKGGSGHPGGTLSLADVMSTLFFGGVLRYDPQDPSWANRDRLVLSEGHTAPILYSLDTNTWQAYNYWGGSGNTNVGISLYGRINDVTQAYISDARAYTVSFDRP